jgi:error-prone DNA polymerase
MPMSTVGICCFIFLIYKKSPSAAVSGAQMNLGFDPPALISSGLPAMTASESVKHEIDRLGIDMSRHMIEFYGEFLNAIGAVSL